MFNFGRNLRHSYRTYGQTAKRHEGLMKLKERADRLKINIPVVFIALSKKDTPVIAKVMAAVTVAYALSPIDLIPDFIPVLGYLDDVIILPALVALTIKFIPDNELQKCKKEAEGMWKNGRPKKWYFGIPVILVWVLLIWIVVKRFV